MKQLAAMSDEIARVVEGGLQFLLEQIEEPQDSTMLRKLGRSYGILSVEDIATVLAASGSKDGEATPVSTLIAKKELALREE